MAVRMEGEDRSISDNMELLVSMQQIDNGMSEAIVLLRAMCLGVRAAWMHPRRQLLWIKSFVNFQTGAIGDAAMFKEFLVKMTMCVLASVKNVFESYLTRDFVDWQSQVHIATREAVEYGKMIECCAAWFSAWTSDLKKIPVLAKEVHNELIFETKKIRKEISILHLRSKICNVIFLPLLFIPIIDDIAAPFIHGGAERDLLRPVVAKQDGELAVGGVVAMTDTLLPAVHRLRRVLMNVADAFVVFHSDLMALASAYPLADKEGPRDEWKRHYQTVRREGFRIRDRSNDMVAVASIYEYYVECVPRAVPKNYPEEWLEEQMCPPELARWLEGYRDELNAAKAKITCEPGFVEHSDGKTIYPRKLEDGATAWTDRSWTFGGVPDEFRGATFFATLFETRKCRFTVRANVDLWVYVYSDPEKHGSFEEMGWEQVLCEGIEKFQWASDQPLNVWKKRVAEKRSLVVGVKTLLTGGVSILAEEQYTGTSIADCVREVTKNQEFLEKLEPY